MSRQEKHIIRVTHGTVLRCDTQPSHCEVWLHAPRDLQVSYPNAVGKAALKAARLDDEGMKKVCQPRVCKSMNVDTMGTPRLATLP